MEIIDIKYKAKYLVRAALKKKKKENLPIVFQFTKKKKKDGVV